MAHKTTYDIRMDKAKKEKELEKVENKTTKNNNDNDIDTKAVNVTEVYNRKKTISKDAIKEVNDFIGNKHDVTPFIYFQVNNFELDTRDPDSRKHYAISLENKKTGVGSGNQFTLTIAYHRDFSDFKSANDLEKALALLEDEEGKEKNNELYHDVNTELFRKRERNDCVLQYGYIDNSIEPTSKYTGKLLEYNVNVNKQIITYTLKGYTSEQAKIGNVNWYPEIKSTKEQFDYAVNGKILVADEFLTRDEISTNLTEDNINEIIENLDKSYTGPIYMNPIKALVAFIYDYNYDLIDKNATKFEIDCSRVGGGIGTGQKEVIGESSLINNLRPVTISLCRNQTPLDYVKYLISMCVENTEEDYPLKYYKDKQNILDRWVYYIENNSEDNKIRIIIDLISSNKYNDDTEYVFEGYTIDNNLLIDYSLNYDGTIALAVSDMLEEKETDHIYIDSYGAIRKSATITKDMFVEGAISEATVQAENTWLDKISVANNCTMTTFGLPFEIPVSTVVRVVFNLGNSKGNNEYHHTSGRCFITGITDKIENSNFTTSFEMVRLPGKYDKNKGA